VLTPREALAHPHLAARAVYAERDGLLQAAPAPRFSATPSATPGAVPQRGEHGAQILREAGLDDEAIARLLGD
jgi:crotonobetainyl-CoA:carnitine CoA-transferase CaiB-like acyl-CoA transferase